jgi:transcriptional regulator with XRE-family HTH domain
MTQAMNTSLRFHFDKPAHALRSAREHAGLSQAEIGTKMGGSQAHVSKIEAGADVRISTLANMARVLGFELMLVPNQLVPAVDALVHGEAGTSPRPRYTLDGDAD